MMVQIHSSGDAWLRAALNSILSAQGDAQSLHLCLAGGTTPRPVYEKLARTEAFRALVASKAVHLWVGDEREAPAHSGLRNSDMIAEIFAAAGFGFKNVAFREAGAALSTRSASAQPASPRRQGLSEEPPGLFLHPWPTGPRESAAAAYEEELLAYAREAAAVGRPWFDLVVLGMGQDGHTAGLFTEEDIRREKTENAVLLTEAPQEPKMRMTMAPRTLLSSRRILVLMQGKPKVRVLMANVFGERADPIQYFLLDCCEVVAQI